MNKFSRLKLLGIALCLAFGLVACTSGTDTTEETTPDTQKAPQEAVTPTPAPVEQTATGELRNVNIEAMTFGLRDATGMEKTFSFSPATRITGIPSVQGLSGKQGSQATVTYVAQGDTNSATSIMISDAAPSTGQKK